MNPKRAKSWPEDAPEGKTWKCPDCGSQATLGGNAGYHRDTEKHSEPVLVDFKREETRIFHTPKPRLSDYTQPVPQDVQNGEICHYLTSATIRIVKKDYATAIKMLERAREACLILKTKPKSKVPE